MRFSDYILNAEPLDEGIKDKIKDTAIKAGRKLGIKKAQNSMTSDEKKAADKIKQENEKARLENAHDSVVKATKMFKKFIQDGLSKYSKSGNSLVGHHFTEVEKLSFCLYCKIPSGMRSDDFKEFYKWKGELYKKCKASNVFIYDEWRNDNTFYFAFKVPSNPKMIKE